MTDSAPGSEHSSLLPGDAERRFSLESEAASLQSVVLSPTQLSDLALILNGAYRPLTGFMNESDYASVLDDLRLAGGHCFPLPVVLDLDQTTARGIRPGERVALRDGEGTAFAVLCAESVWRRDPGRETEALGSDDGGRARGACCVGGTVEGIRLPGHPFYAWLKADPDALGRRFTERGFTRVLAVETKDRIRPEDHAVISRAAAELDAAVLLHPAVGPPDSADVHQVVRIKCHLAALSRFPATTTLLALLDYPGGNSSVRDILMHARLRRRFGASHFMMRGVSQAVLDADPRVADCVRDIGIEMVAWPERLAFSAQTVPPENDFPEVAAVLEAHYEPRERAGFTLFFTGLSGSGKSTIAKIVQARIAERDPRPVTLLDGDIVRRHISRDLGFSRQDRDTNVRRIGAVAADLTKAGGIAICCPIAPYARSRSAVREIIDPYGPMIEVHLATPLAICEQRDPKGLYKRAREGRLKNFTGVDDPYEEPVSPELRIDTSSGTPEAAAGEVLEFLVRSALIPAAF